MTRFDSYSIAVIGLGSMGMGVARSCIRAGLNTAGIDINPVALDTLKTFGAANVSQTGLEFADQLDAVVVLVVNDAQAQAALLDSGLAERLQPHTPIMVSCTQSAQSACTLSEKLRKHELPMLDAPVSGGATKAQQGTLTVMASGSETTFGRLQPVLKAIAEKVYRIGPEIGQGSSVKVIHQLLAGVHIAAAAEAMALAARANIPLETLYDVVTHAAGNSWMFEDRMKDVLEGDYSPRSTVDIFVKDLGLVSDMARSLRFPTPLGSAALNLFINVSNSGHGQENDSAVIKGFHDINLPCKEPAV